MRRLAVFAFLVLLSVFGATAFAQHHPETAAHKAEEAAEEAGGSSGWKWANFALLVGVLGYVAAKKAGPFYAARSREIHKSLAESKEFLAEAESRMAAVEGRMARLQADIDALRHEARLEEANESERARQEMIAEIAKIQAHAEREIGAATSASRMELRRYTAELAIGLAEQKIQAQITPKDQEALVRGFVTNLGRPASRAQSI